jgi:hypothetical protein
MRDSLTMWWRGVRAAWSPTPRRRSRAESIAAGVTLRRQVSGLFVLALVAMGAAVSVVSCQSTPDLSDTPLGPIFGSDRGTRVSPTAAGGREPEIRVRIRTRVPGVTLAGPRTLSFRPVGTTTPVLVQTPIAVTISPRGFVTRDPAGSTREWGPGVDLDLQAVGEDPDRVVLVVDGTSYPGTLALRGKWRESGLAFDVISALPMETYLAGVLQKELYDGWPRQAYEAQAIAARSYAIHERARARASNRAHDVESTTLDQAYGGLPTRAVAIEAARATRGMVLTYEGPGGGQIRVKGRGFGHGVGLCQYCAKGFAERGRDAATMLRTFYPRASMTKSY